jgi:alpha-amylase
VVQQHQLLIRSALGALALCGSTCQRPPDPGQHVAMTTVVQDWRDEIIYQLMTDRFADGDLANDFRVDPSALTHYQGGDYRGIEQRLDYLQTLGVTTLWISPIMKNVDADAGFDAYHGYWAVDLESLNPHFGDLSALRQMIDAAHQRGIKVILDIVTNHLGQVFYYDINNNGRPDEWLSGTGAPMDGASSSAMLGALSRVTEYDPDYDPRGVQAFTSLGGSGLAPIRFFDMPEIFREPPTPAIFRDPAAYHRRGRVTDWNVPEQVVMGDFPGGLKDLDTSNPDVRQALTDAYVEWVLKTDIDGFRIDTIKHVETAFWTTFAPQVRQRLADAGKTNFFMFGEAFDGDDTLVGSYTGPDQMDSVFYFPQKYQVFDDVFMKGGPTSKVQELFDQRSVHYGGTPQPGGVGIPPRELLVNFIDNHDVPRFLFSGVDVAALRAALVYLFTEDGIPCVYYGTEQEYSGGADPGNREPLWLSGYRTDGATFQLIAKLAGARKTYVAFRRGDFHLTWTTNHTGDEPDAGMLAFERRTTAGDYALVVINTHGKPSQTSSAGTTAASGGPSAAMKVSAAPGSKLIDVLSGSTFTVDPDGTLALGLAGYQSAVLVPAAAYVP